MSLSKEQVETRAETARQLGFARRRHGHAPSAKYGRPSLEYSSWANMIARCTRRSHPDWGFYGGRGITVCDRWRDFVAFLEDMGPRAPGLSLDRTDNSGNYEPGNCRWVTRKEQRANQREAKPHSNSGLKGVSWVAKEKKWKATVCIKGSGGKSIHLGYFRTIEAAAETVRLARLDLELGAAPIVDAESEDAK